jgi:hypothetical protein
MANLSMCNKPLAAPGLTSYRYRSAYGWTMIGAVDHGDALREAGRSLGSAATIGKLEIWDADAGRYVAARPL